MEVRLYYHKIPGYHRLVYGPPYEKWCRKKYQLKETDDFAMQIKPKEEENTV